MNEDAIAETESLSAKYKGLIGHLKNAALAAKSINQPLKGLLSQNDRTKVRYETSYSIWLETLACMTILA
jgi:hypothetical protein